MENINIQKHENQTIRKIFDDAGELLNVLVVGLDYAEEEHQVVICNGLGDCRCNPFTVKNNKEGLAFLVTRISNLCTKYTINKSHVFAGGETPGSWAVNFAYQLQLQGFPVIDLHPHRVAKFTENETTNTDKLSAMTICRCLINKMGITRSCDEIYTELKLAVRARSQLAKTRTRISNQIHTCCDTYFPGFLTQKNSGIVPFSKPCFFILENHSIQSIRSAKSAKLVRMLKKNGASNADKTAEKLKNLANVTLESSPTYEQQMRIKIKHLMAQYSLIDEQMASAEQEVAFLLRQTPGALLTSIDGISVTLASQLTAEFGNPELTKNIDCKVTYFGLSKRTHQTGGEDKPKKKKGKSPRINKHGKRAALMGVTLVLEHGPHEFRDYFQQRQLSGKNGTHALGRKLLRLVFSILKAPHDYVPKDLQGLGRKDPLWQEHYKKLEKKMKRKWGKFTRFPPPNQDVLHNWKNIIKSVFGVEINLGI
jgi:transposase